MLKFCSDRKQWKYGAHFLPRIGVGVACFFAKQKVVYICSQSYLIKMMMWIKHSRLESSLAVERYPD